jgi:hypothetical protein
MSTNSDNTSKLIETAKAIGVILGVPLGLFAVFSNLFQQPLIASLIVAVITAVLASTWMIYSRRVNTTSLAFAWLAFVLLILAGLVVWPRTMIVEGHITDTASNPITNEIVRLFDYSGRMYETQTNIQGYYQFLDVPSGKYAIQASNSKVEGESKGILVRVIEQNIIVIVNTNIPNPSPTLTNMPLPIETSTNIPTSIAQLPIEMPMNTSMAYTSHLIYYNESLAYGYDMGMNTSDGLTDWVIQKNGDMCMAYPDGQSWGSVFITVGKPTDYPRPSQDLSIYKKLSVELRGDVGNEFVLVGLKDNTDPDDGTETKVRLWDLSTRWETFEFPLSEFNNADLHNLYIVIEFIFEKTPETICFRNIQYLP